MLKDVAVQYYTTQNFNCAEAVVHAGNDYYHLGLDENAMRLMGAFGGGVQNGTSCGAFLSAASLLGMRYIETRAHDSKNLKPSVQLLMRRFKEKLGSTLCCEIKPKFHTKELGCRLTVEAACDVLEEVIAEYEASRA